MKFEDLLGKFAGVKRESTGWIALCPAHGDTKPSLRIALGATQPVIMTCRTDHCSLKSILAAAKVTYAQFKAVEVPESVTDEISITQHKSPAGNASVARLRGEIMRYATALRADTPDACAALTYAQRFGVDGQRASELQLGLSVEGAHARLIVPFQEPTGAVRGYQGRAIDPSYSGPAKWLTAKSPSETEAWSPLAWMPGVATDCHELPVIVTEGPGDGLTASSAAGFDVVSIAGATQRNPGIVEQLIEWTEGRTLIVAGDADRAGQLMTSELVVQLRKAGATAFPLTLPEGTDLTDLFATHGGGFAQWLRDAISAAQNPQATVQATPGSDVVTTAELTEPGSQNLNEVLALGRDGESDEPAIQWNLSETGISDKGATRQLAAWQEQTYGTHIACSRGTWMTYRESEGVWKAEQDHVIDRAIVEFADVMERSGQLAKRGGQELSARIAQLDELDPERDALREKLADAVAFKKLDDRVNGDSGFAMLNRMLRVLQSVDPNSFDQHPYLLNCKNGVYDSRTDELLPHDPDLKMLRQVDADFDPEAICPTWDTFLSRAHAEHPEVIDYLQEVAGASLFGMGRDQIIIGHTGSGGNGKGTFSGVLEAIFDTYAVAPDMSVFLPKTSSGGPSPEIIALKGRKFIFASEKNENTPMDEAFLKRLSGGDTISSRALFKDMAPFLIEGIIQISLNKDPIFRDQTNGIWRRYRRIVWRASFGTDNTLKDELLAERDGILNWVLEGWRRRHERGHLETPESVVLDTANLREELDVFREFIPNVLVPGVGERIGKHDAFAAFRNWIEHTEGKHAKHLSARTFKSELVGRGFEEKKTGGWYYYEGLRLHTAPSTVEKPEPAPAQAPAPAAPQPSAQAPAPEAIPEPANTFDIDVDAWLGTP